VFLHFLTIFSWNSAAMKEPQPQQWPVIYLKETVDGKQISDLELQILCNSLNGGNLDVSYTFSSTVNLVQSMLRNPTPFKKSGKSKELDTAILCRALVCPFFFASAYFVRMDASVFLL
jgi:hypothetical protein